MAFMRGWYNIHDHTNLKMGFHTIDADAKVQPITASSTPTEELPYVEVNINNFWFGLDPLTFLIVASIAVVVTATVVLVVMFCFVEFLTRVLRTMIFGKGRKVTAPYKDGGEETISLVILQ
jgi:hypothetical protein